MFLCRAYGILVELPVGVLPPDVPNISFSITATFSGSFVSEGAFHPDMRTGSSQSELSISSEGRHHRAG